MTDSAPIPELLPARMLNAFVYCPRLFHLEWAQKEWAASADTIAGSRDHRRVDRDTGRLPEPDALSSAPIEARAVLLSAPEEGLIAKFDLIEGNAAGLIPVDTKHGAPPDEGGFWDSDEVQLVAQALILRENGYPVEKLAIFYGATRQRVELPLTDDMITRTRAAISAAREAAKASCPPAPLLDSPRCPRCSLVGICLPDEVCHATATDASEPASPRRLYPARDDAVPVYVQAQGGRIGKKDDGLEIWEREKGRRRVRLIDTSQVSVFGNVTVTSGAIATLMGQGIPLCYFSYGGWFHGMAQPLGSPNVFQRIAQHRVIADPKRSLDLARKLISRKIQNQRTLLRRNGREVDPAILRDLKQDSERALEARGPESLLGTEGSAARRYFSSFANMLHPPSSSHVAAFDFGGRNRRPPKDPVNALLSLAYSILAKDWLITLTSVGLDPYYGFFHQPRFGRAALALDLMEEFRPLIADSVVLQLINNGEVQPDDFIERGGAFALRPEGRKRFFLAYERRMSHLITHPDFGYTISYRRLLEVQSRLFSRHLTDELPDYKGFTTR